MLPSRSCTAFGSRLSRGALVILVLLSQPLPPLSAASLIGLPPAFFTREISPDGETVVGSHWYGMFSVPDAAYVRLGTGNEVLLRWRCEVPRYGVFVGGTANAAASGNGLIVGGGGVLTGVGEASGCDYARGIDGLWSGNLQRDDGVVVELTGVTPDERTVVGNGQTPLGWQAFRATSEGEFEWLGVESKAVDVSAGGDRIVGGHAVWSSGSGWTPIGLEARAITPNGRVAVGQYEGKPALWTEGAGVLVLSSVAGQATGVSADGSLIVGVYDESRVFLWTSARGFEDLEEVLRSRYALGSALEPWSDLGYAGLGGSNGPAVSDDGLHIAGTGTLSSSTFPFQAWSVELDATATLVAGDANLDARVDLSDFGILKAGFGTGHFWREGDFNADFRIDLTDFGVLKQNFGARMAAPEPAALELALVGGALLAALATRQVGARWPCFWRRV